MTVPLARVTETGKVDLLTGLTSRIFNSPSAISLDLATKVNPPALLVGTGVGVALAVALGVAVSEGLALGELAATFAPFFQINFPLDFTQTYVYPWKTIFCPSFVAFNVGPIAAIALDPNMDRSAAGTIARRLRRISFMSKTVIPGANMRDLKFDLNPMPLSQRLFNLITMVAGMIDVSL